MAKVQGDSLDMMTADEVAKKFKIGRSSVDRLVRAGLPVVLLGRGPRKRTYRIRRSRLVEWVAEHEGVLETSQIPEAELERMRPRLLMRGVTKGGDMMPKRTTMDSRRTVRRRTASHLWIPLLTWRRTQCQRNRYAKCGKTLIATIVEASLSGDCSMG
jgi:hypothetical protein